MVNNEINFILIYTHNKISIAQPIKGEKDVELISFLVQKWAHCLSNDDDDEKFTFDNSKLFLEGF